MTERYVVASDAIRNRYLQDGAGVVPPARLLVMVYDKLVLDLEQALEGLPVSDWDLVSRKLINAQAIVLELHSALKLDAWDGAAGLSELYKWFDSELTLANVRKSEKHIRPVLKMVRELRGAWVQASEQVLTEQAAATAAARASVPSMALGNPA